VAIVRPFDEPWQTNYQREANDALEAAMGPSDAYWRALRPPLPQIPYLPPRFGYPTYVERQWTVMQVFGITRTPNGTIPGMPTTRPEERTDYSKVQQTDQGSGRNENFDPLGLGGASW
jgi:hypothetical protein